MNNTLETLRKKKFESLELSLIQMQMQQTVGNGSSSSNTHAALPEITPAAREGCLILTMLPSVYMNTLMYRQG